MPSLFSRSKSAGVPGTTSSSKQPTTAAPHLLDEFGRLSPFPRAGTPLGTSTPPVSGKNGKKKANKDARARTISGPRPDYDPGDFLLAAIPDGSFLPLNLDPPRDEDDETPSGAIQRPPPPPPPAPQQDYGFLAHQRHVVLGPHELTRLVTTTCEQLCARGLTTPFVFSSSAPGLSAGRVRRLVDAFVRTCARGAGQKEEKLWAEEATFAGPHELGMALRWGLARVVRVVGGQEVRGLIDYDMYADWRDAETALQYPPDHLAGLISPLHPSVRTTLLTLLALLARLTAHSASSGHTPPSLSPLFGPLLFGLGPAAASFHGAYAAYLRAVHATEHLLLAFVRWQDARAAGAGGAAAALGVPAKLKDWIRGYPAMLPSHAPNVIRAGGAAKERYGARPGARTVRVTSVRRNVRAYHADLVKSAASWAYRRPGQPPNGLAASREWTRVIAGDGGMGKGMSPRVAEAYRKKMDLPPGWVPDDGSRAPPPLVSSSQSEGGGVVSAAPSAASSLSSSTASTLVEDDYFALGGASAATAEWGSLVDLKWGAFETVGFGGVKSEEKLKFDLTEGARAARSAKRQTLSWDDFSSAGFTRTDAPLSATLQFSAPVERAISTLPQDRAEMGRKLRKTHRALPPFGWDTDPVMGREEWVEEAFVDVFCDLIYGGGWMDLERTEEVERECNWALVEFKALPLSGRATVPAGADPRTASSLFLFEEFVPAEYRAQLAQSGPSSSAKRRLNIFSTNKHKHWKQATTLNGRPYVVGNVPHSPNAREAEFEYLLKGDQSKTRLVTPQRPTSTRTQPGEPPVPTEPVPPLPRMPMARPTVATGNNVFMNSNSNGSNTEIGSTPSTPNAGGKRGSRFRLPGSPLVGPNGQRIVPAEAERLDFETRLASESDEDAPGSRHQHQRRPKREDSQDGWVDILVANHGRRLGTQDASERRAARRMHDPELASLEVAAALAALQDRPFSDEDDESIEPAHALAPPRPAHAHQQQDSISSRESVVLRPSEEPAFAVMRPRRDGNGSSPALTRDSGAESGSEEKSYAGHNDDDDDADADVRSATSGLAVLRTRAAGGYFAAHPDRRPQTMFEDPRTRLASEDTDDDDDDNESAEAEVEDSPYGGLENARLPPPRVQVSVAPPSPVTATTPKPAEVPRSVSPSTPRAAANPPFVPSVIQPLRPRPVSPSTSGGGASPPLVPPVVQPLRPRPISPSTSGSGATPPLVPPAVQPLRPASPGGGMTTGKPLSPLVSPTAPRSPLAGPPAPIAAAAVPASSSDSTRGPSKTAALIEMYRDKERGRTTPGAPAGPRSAPGVPNAIPTVINPPRSASLPQPAQVPQPTPAPSKLPVRTPAPALSPPEAPRGRSTSPVGVPLTDENGVPMPPPPKAPFQRVAAPSPPRYVHGAPLHNVVEEEEED